MSGSITDPSQLPGVLDNERWIQRWDAGDIRFHKPRYTPFLDSIAERLFNGEKKTVFIPLCGKSLDLIWFYERGHTVFGVEVAEQPVIEFFQEHNMDVAISATEDMAGKLYSSKDGRLRLYVADLFGMHPDVCGQCDVVYDCRSLSAVNVADQKRYAELMLTFMKTDAVYLLYVKEYDPAVWPGPPHTISEERINHLYGNMCDIEKVEEENRKSCEDESSKESTSSTNIEPRSYPGMKTSSYLYTRWFCLTLKTIKL